MLGIMPTKRTNLANSLLLHALSRYRPPKNRVRPVTINPKTFCSTNVAVAKVQGYFQEVRGMIAMYGVPFPVLVKGPRAVYSGFMTALSSVNAIKVSSKARVKGGRLTRAILWWHLNWRRWCSLVYSYVPVSET